MLEGLRGEESISTICILNEEEFGKIKEKYFWIEFDEYGFEFFGNWSDGIIEFFDDLSEIIKKGKVIVDYDGDESRDIKQFKISKNRLMLREAKRIVFNKWHIYKDDM